MGNGNGTCYKGNGIFSPSFRGPFDFPNCLSSQSYKGQIYNHTRVCESFSSEDLHVCPEARKVKHFSEKTLSWTWQFMESCVVLNNFSFQNLNVFFNTDTSWESHFMYQEYSVFGVRMSLKSVGEGGSITTLPITLLYRLGPSQQPPGDCYFSSYLHDLSPG